MFCYTIANIELHRCVNFKDLGITLDSKLSFAKHTDDVIAKSFRIYGAIIWCSLYDVHVNDIEAVQRKFLKFSCYCVDKVYPERGCDHAALLSRFEFPALQDRRNIIVPKICF